MSSRVTRSSAKKSASLLPLNADQSSPATLSIPQPASLKRKAAATTSLEEQQDVIDPLSARRSKRRKGDQGHQPPATPPSKRQKKGKGKVAAMSNSGTLPDPSDENLPSPPAVSSSSRRKSGKSKKATPDDASTGAVLLNKRTRPSSSRKATSSANKRDDKEDGPAGQSGQNTKQDDMSDVSGSEGPPPNYNEDDDMDDDPFESSFLGRHGPPGMSNTLRALSGMMSGTSSRLRTLLERLRQKDDPSIQLIALTELSELLLVSTEDNLAGHFSPDTYVKELVSLMQPNDFGEENAEMMLLACRCIANMMEALPASTATVVYSGAVPVLLSKLLEISYMDLAEQALITLEKISAEFPAAIVRDGGLSACLTFLDFFPTSTQRTAVTTAANCCRNIPEDSFTVVKDVMPILLGVLTSNDQRVVEQGCLCVSRIVESFKYQDDKLEELMSTELLSVILRFLLPGSTNLIGPNIHTQFLRVLSITARASPSLTVELFKMNVVDTLYQILTGVSPPSGVENVGQNIDSVLIMQALIHRPREQVFETLNVICELLPGLDEAGMGIVDDYLDRAAKPANSVLARVRKSPLQKRVEMLANCKDELKRFAVILLPTLTDAYSSTVNLSVRQKVLTAQLKMLSNLDSDILEDALKDVPYASYLASILSQQDHPFLVTAALQAAELLITRLESIYRYQFYREGVIAEVKKLADRPTDLVESKQLTARNANIQEPPTPPAPPLDLSEPTMAPTGEDASSDGDEDDDDLDHGPDDGTASSESTGSPEARHVIPPVANIQDMITSFAKKFIGQYENEAGRKLRESAAKILDDLQCLVNDISVCYNGGRPDDGAKLFARLARYFKGDALDSITSYELLTSKVVSTLLEIFEESVGQSNDDARVAFVEVFMGTMNKQKRKVANGQSPTTPFSILIHQLQDLLSRSEHFEVVTVHQNSFDSNRSSPASMLAKQIRVRLVANDESGIPRPFRNIMVSIHAIATFKALDDYLRPRISLVEQPRPDRHRDISGSATNAYTAALAGLDGLDGLSARTMAARPPITPPGNQAASRASARKSSKSKALAASTSVSEATASTKQETALTPRRSSRKVKSQGENDTAHTRHSRSAFAKDLDNSQATLEIADETQLSDENDMDESSALETIVGDLEDEGDEDLPDPSAVNLEVAATGKVTAREDDGTRVATPTDTRVSAVSHLAASTRRHPSELARSLLGFPGGPMSYAAALQQVPQDWHIEFSVNGQPITNETTIYRAVHFNKNPTEDVTVRNIWSAVHTINFKRVSGPAPAEPNTLTPPPESPVNVLSGLPQSLDRNPTTASILRLMRILHEMNANLDDVLVDNSAAVKIQPEPLAQFVNAKLTAKLNRQLEEPLIVASNCLPSWSEDLARLYPFLFPFETRHLFLQSTSYGYSRSMTRWQNAQSANNSRRDRHRDERPFLGRLQRQKVRIARTKLLESAFKVMELYGASPSILEVEFFNEVGTGLGPTLEFYSNASKEFSRKKLHLWRENESTRSDEFAFGKRGLFPAPISESQADEENGKKILTMFKMLGKFVARSMLDSRLIDVSFNPTFFRTTDGINGVTPSLGAVKSVDEDLAKALQILKQYVVAKKRIEEQSRLSPAQKMQKLSKVQVNGASVEDLGLDFTLPGYPSIELMPKGSNMAVTLDNIGLYIEKVIQFTLGKGVHRQIDAFRAGFSQVFPYSALKAFTPDELVMLFGSNDEDWTIETLMDSMKADHGYNLDSKSVRNLLQYMIELPMTAQKDFLQFVTGSPKLPIGGFKSLTPMFTVVCRPSEAPFTPDDYLPSVMTCVNYLKLPDYSTLGVMRQKMNMAIREGQGAFHLS